MRTGLTQIQPQEVGPRDIGLLSLWFASLAGLGTTAFLATSEFLLRHYVHSRWEVIWQAPLSYAFLFLPTALLLIAAGRLYAPARSLRTALTILWWLTAFGLSLGYPRLARWAGAILALGLAMQLARLMAPRWTLFKPIMWRTLVAMLGFQAAGGIGLIAWRTLEERKALASSVATEAGRPNVLLLVLDTVRAISLSLYGYDRPTTPWLTSFAATGVRFDQAIATAPWTLPSHASMMTGQWAQALSANWERPLDGTYPTLAEQLSARGYATAGFVANTYYLSRESGLARGFAHYDDYDLITWEIVRVTPLGKLVLDSKVVRWAVGRRHKLGRKSADDINRELLAWLDKREGSRPFFAFLNYFDAHGPYQPRAPYDSLFGAPGRLVNPELDPKPETWTPEEVSAQSAAYHASIAGLDSRLGELMGALDQRGLLDNTLVIVTSDHGEEFLEHGVMAHGNSLFRQSVHVPLVMRLPGRLPAGAVVPTPVSLRDIPATVMDLTGNSAEQPFQGRSLARFFTNPGPPTYADSGIVLSFVDHARGLPTTYPVSGGAVHSVMLDGYRILEGEDGRGQWYRAEDITERDTIPSTEVPDTIRRRARAALEQMPLARRSDLGPARP